MHLPLLQRHRLRCASHLHRFHAIAEGEHQIGMAHQEQALLAVASRAWQLLSLRRPTAQLRAVAGMQHGGAALQQTFKAIQFRAGGEVLPVVIRALRQSSHQAMAGAHLKEHFGRFTVHAAGQAVEHQQRRMGQCSQQLFKIVPEQLPQPG